MPVAHITYPDLLGRLAAPGEILGTALALGAQTVPEWSDAEHRLVAWSPGQTDDAVVDATRLALKSGRDPLGDALGMARSPTLRRRMGAVFTPFPVVQSMMRWAARQGTPDRIIDPGAGSCRFALAAAHAFPKAEILAVEIDPLSAIVGRANLAASGLAGRVDVVCVDYRRLELEHVRGKTLYVGNPPYVRHHDIEPRWKDWLVETSHSRGLRASRLAGLHVHFFLATVEYAAQGDWGAFITSAEWLDVNYGSLVRALLLNGLGGLSIHVLEPTVFPFEGVATTGAITCFEVGARPKSIQLNRVPDVGQLGGLEKGAPVTRARLETCNRWTTLTRVRTNPPRDHVELGELCRVHRGTATGSNATWVFKPNLVPPLPESVLFPCVTRASELFEAGPQLQRTDHLSRAANIPADLSKLSDSELEEVERFLASARHRGAADTYLARHRRPWWSIGLRDPAPILATYMARRPPAFVRNVGRAYHLNIAHGLYPRDAMTDEALDALALYLRENTGVEGGRTYAGGLVKFEPREMERLIVPEPSLLVAT